MWNLKTNSFLWKLGSNYQIIWADAQDHIHKSWLLLGNSFGSGLFNCLWKDFFHLVLKYLVLTPEQQVWAWQDNGIIYLDISLHDRIVWSLGSILSWKEFNLLHKYCSLWLLENLFCENVQLSTVELGMRHRAPKSSFTPIGALYIRYSWIFLYLNLPVAQESNL